MTGWTARTMLGLIAAAALAGCGGPDPLRVDDAWIRLPAVPGRPAAGYFTLHGGPAATTLIGADYDIAIRSELHQSMTAGGMATMRPLASVPVPARVDTAFQPGGRHVMLFGLNPIAKPGRRVNLLLTFADNRRLTASVVIVAAGAPAPDG